MKLRIAHTTSYEYSQPVSYALQQLRLTPSNSVLQTVLSWNFHVEGGRIEFSYADQHENQTSLVQVNSNESKVVVKVTGEVETHNTAGVLGKAYGKAPLWHFLQATPRTKPGKNINRLSKLIGASDNLLGDLHQLSAEVLSSVPYDKSFTSSETTAEAAMTAGGGVCQDHAQIFIAAVRKAGVPARYVSGYLMMNDRVDQDASHAWAEVHVDDLGWVGFDVSNGICPDEHYVRLATGLDSKEAAPISGIRQGDSSESMIVSVQVQQ